MRATLSDFQVLPKGRREDDQTMQKGHPQHAGLFAGHITTLVNLGVKVIRKFNMRAHFFLVPP